MNAVLSAAPSGSQKFSGIEVTVDRLSAVAPTIEYLHLALPWSDGLVQLAGSRLGPAEIYGLKLDTIRLVSISGGLSLQSCRPWFDAFATAGCNALLLAQASKPDDGGQGLLGTFYQSIKEGKSPGQSLQAAQLAALANPKTAYPSYWASFTLVGDWR